MAIKRVVSDNPPPTIFPKDWAADVRGVLSLEEQGLLWAFLQLFARLGADGRMELPYVETRCLAADDEIRRVAKRLAEAGFCEVETAPDGILVVFPWLASDARRREQCRERARRFRERRKNVTLRNACVTHRNANVTLEGDGCIKYDAHAPARFPVPIIGGIPPISPKEDTPPSDQKPAAPKKRAWRPGEPVPESRPIAFG